MDPEACSQRQADARCRSRAALGSAWEHVPTLRRPRLRALRPQSRRQHKGHLLAADTMRSQSQWNTAVYAVGCERDTRGRGA